MCINNKTSKLIAIFYGIIICFILCSCAYAKPYGYEIYSKFSEIPNRNNLYYDPETKIVYFIHKEFLGYKGYGFMSPYIAKNGLPYMYDTEAALVEIEPENN